MSNVDYIGKYVKKFESGSKGSLALSSCGNDWGLSCGSYQLTLRWGNCVRFLKKYFPNEASSLYFNNVRDIKTPSWPGPEYCSSPDVVISVWMQCYNKAGAGTFFLYEHDYMCNNYYFGIKSKIQDILDLDTADRGFQECFWSWAIHRGVTGSYDAFMEVLKENNITSLDYVDKEKFFDMIYDKRYEKDKVNRYKKSVITGWSEREVLRPLIGKGTFSGRTKEDELLKLPNVNPCDGTLKVIYKGSDGLNVRELPSFDSKVVDIYTYGKTETVIGITDDNSMYKLSNGYYITANSKYVQFNVKRVPEYTELYRVRIIADSLDIYKGPGMNYDAVGKVTKNQIFTIIEETEDGWGLLKSKTGWIYLPNYTKKWNK